MPVIERHAVTAPGGENLPERRRKRWVIAGVIALVVFLLVAGGLLMFGPVINAAVRSKMQAALSARFDADVQFQRIDAGLFPSFRLTASGMVVRRKGDADLPPLMQASGIQAEGSVLAVLFGHVRRVKLDGLLVNIPLGRKKSPDSSQKKTTFPVVIDEIVSDGAHLTMLRTASEKPPLEFDIHHLQMKSVDLDKSAPFHATLTNPEPRGEIETNGQFGPWDAEEPSGTPVSGTYVFSNADLATLKGIGGILSSQGKYKGILSRIDVDGETKTPDFFLALSGHRMPLATTFHATVDGTNGNTWLQPVEGKLKNTPITALGEITKVQDVHGRRIQLDGTVKNGRLEDVLELAVKASPPPLSGLLNLQTKIDLPPGDEDVIRKLRLDGNFNIQSARFASLNIRQRLQGLSRRSKGMPEDENAGSSITNMKGRFALRGGVATFSDLEFEIEGATIHLTGRYDLQSEQLEFRGKLLMDAKLSQTTTGAKSFFLKAIDPLFHKKNGGSELPIKITGTRSSPAFGLDMGSKF